ncbi:hypothetical protein [Kitasatospora sp. NPDC090091]|uniref:hypothetical protein n=1 Tax=Kitasatospora sp. NPDC090091 TaxID=3364081 RepID=UPI003815D015
MKSGPDRAPPTRPPPAAHRPGPPDQRRRTRYRHTPEGTGIPFGIVERIGPDGTWGLFFDSLPMMADKNQIGGLFQRLMQP